jgi:hypothetical protein
MDMQRRATQVVGTSPRGSGSESGLASSSPWVSLCGGMMDVDKRYKGMMMSGGALMTWCSIQEEGKMKIRLSGGKSDQGRDDLL